MGRDCPEKLMEFRPGQVMAFYSADTLILHFYKDINFGPNLAISCFGGARDIFIPARANWGKMILNLNSLIRPYTVRSKLFREQKTMKKPTLQNEN